MSVYFSWDMTAKEKDEYRKQYPLFKIDEHGMLMRRTHLHVLKQRRSEDGKEYCDGFSCEAGYKYVTDELLGLSWLGMIAYVIYKYIKKSK